MDLPLLSRAHNGDSNQPLIQKRMRATMKQGVIGKLIPWKAFEAEPSPKRFQ